MIALRCVGLQITNRDTLGKEARFLTNLLA